jgi:hypothetical protein
MERYFVIINSDGDTTVDVVTKDVLLERLDENYYGNREFLSSIPKGDTNYWGDSILIIKGDVVTPTPITTITKFDIE